jgi:DNA/RNA endonuclease YhcR with UshA esterase domain
MSRKLQGLGLAALLALALNAGAAHAQAAAVTSKSAIPPSYDISKEVTLNATVESLPSKSGTGLRQSGSTGFVLQTSVGTVQGSLTPFVFHGTGSLSIKAGQTIQVTGVMKTVTNNKQVFVIRTIKTGGRTYAIRDQHGFPLEHPAQNTSAAYVSKGGQL